MNMQLAALMALSPEFGLLNPVVIHHAPSQAEIVGYIEGQGEVVLTEYGAELVAKLEAPVPARRARRKVEDADEIATPDPVAE